VKNRDIDHVMPLRPLTLPVEIVTMPKEPNFEMLPSPMTKVIPELKMELKGFRKIHQPFAGKKKSKTVTCKTILDNVINRIDNLHHKQIHSKVTSPKSSQPE
jgi:hypothetical protein